MFELPFPSVLWESRRLHCPLARRVQLDDLGWVNCKRNKWKRRSFWNRQTYTCNAYFENMYFHTMKEINSWFVSYFYSVSSFRPHTATKFPGKNKIRFTEVSRIKQLYFGMQNWWTFKERTVLAARAFQFWRFLRNKVVLPVKLIQYFLHFSLFYEVYNENGKYGSLR